MYIFVIVVLNLERPPASLDRSRQTVRRVKRSSIDFGVDKYEADDEDETQSDGTESDGQLVIDENVPGPSQSSPIPPIPPSFSPIRAGKYCFSERFFTEKLVRYFPNNFMF